MCEKWAGEPAHVVSQHALNEPVFMTAFIDQVYIDYMCIYRYKCHAKKIKWATNNLQPFKILQPRDLYWGLLEKI